MYFRIAAQNPKSLCTLVWNQDSGSLAELCVAEVGPGVFNTTPADFVLMSADVVLKTTALLKEMSVFLK